MEFNPFSVRTILVIALVNLLFNYIAVKTVQHKHMSNIVFFS